MSTTRTPINPDQLALSPADAASLLGVSRATFFKLHSSGKLPLPVYLTPRCPRRSRAELVGWLDAGAPDRRTWERMKRGASDELLRLGARFPEADEILLEVLAEAVRVGQTPTPGEILERARERDPVTFKLWHATSVSRRLKNYGIDPPKKTNGKKPYRHVTRDALLKIQRHYAIDLGFLDSDRTPPPVNTPARTCSRRGALLEWAPTSVRVGQGRSGVFGGTRAV